MFNTGPSVTNWFCPIFKVGHACAKAPAGKQQAGSSRQIWLIVHILN
jgi:hypothetical protein